MEEMAQAWVTFASTDTEALEAIVLAKSLEQVKTTRKVWILISENVTREMKNLLLQVFHGIIPISADELKNVGGLNSDASILKLWCWKLTQFEKCVFVGRNLLITNNCDEVFKFEQFSAAQDPAVIDGFNPLLFVLKPSFETFGKLLKIAQGIKKDLFTGDQVLVSAFSKNWLASPEKHIPESSDMVQISNVPELWKCNDETIVGRMTQEWQQIYFQNVVPFLNGQTNKHMQEYIQELLNSTSLLQESTNKIKDLAISIDGNNNPDNMAEYKNTIAIIGMSCRLPGANSPAEYWKLLSEGREAIRDFPDERHYYGDPKARRMKAGYLNCPVDEFDAKLFGISPREAMLMDPQQRLLLEVTWEALENAGINPMSLRDSNTGVYVGLWQQDYERIIMGARDKGNSDFLHVFLGNKYSATASRVSFCLGFNGPAVAIESGCSSSLTGLHMACESLYKGETSLALASGVNLILLPFNPFSGRADTDNGVVLSNDYKCKTFDESADGFVRAEGCGVVALKRFEDAIRDGDNILAIVKGTAINNDGTGVSFGTPNEKAQELVFRAALKQANVNAADVSYVETHGTGTSVGDPIEMYAIGQAYAEGRTEPLLVGSVKTNIGHCEAAAGIASLIKVILCMQNSAIPKHLNLTNLNPRIDLSRIPAEIPLKLTPWKPATKIAAVSSFSMSATNAHAIIQESPKFNTRLNSSEAEGMEVVTMSAKSEEALEAMRQKYMEFLKREDNSSIALKDIAYTLATGRAHLQHRIAIVASTNPELLTNLEKRNFTQGKLSTLKCKTGFIFTGQGSQYPGMGKGLYEAFPAFRQAMDQCENLFQKHLKASLKSVIWSDDEKSLNQTLFCQPAIFCLEYCLTQLWNHFGIKPDAVLGHSVGEFAACVCAGILTLEDTMTLVVRRSQLVHGLPRGSMLAVRTSEKSLAELIKLCTEKYENGFAIDIAAVNSQEEVVVSGSTSCVQQFEGFCFNNEVKHIKIPASHAFHSREVDPVLEEFGISAAGVQIRPQNCTYISGTLAKVMETMEFGSQYWQRHLRDTVRFSDAVQILWKECKILVEVGPQPILLGLAMANVEDTERIGVFCPTLRRSEEAKSSVYSAIKKLYVSGAEFDWKSMYGIRQKYLNLPLYPFQRQKYWIADELEKDDEMGELVHPLLGRQFMSPLSETVFSQVFNVQDLSYLEDHKVADCVVVPAAAMLETFLAASREVLQGGSKNRFTITVENLRVEAVLPLESRCRIQTVISTQPSNSEKDIGKYQLALNRKLDNHFDKWKRHAIAEFTPSSNCPSEITLDLETLKQTLSSSQYIGNAYKAIADAGIQFGPKFQSISAAWFDSSQILTEIHVPEKSEDYICQPIVLDAMIQTSAFREYLVQSDLKPVLRMPISIRKFTWLSRPLSAIVFAHRAGERGNVTLYNSNGEQLALMEGLELIETSVNTVRRSIRADSLEVPDFMCDTWRPVLGKMDSRVNMAKMLVPSISSFRISTVIDEIEGIQSEHLTEISPEPENQQNPLRYHKQQLKLMLAYFLECIKGYRNNDGILRILEIGQNGSADILNDVGHELKKLNIAFHYSLTDSKSASLHNLESVIGQRSGVTLQLLDLKQDSFIQGFSPEEFDIVLWSNFNGSQNLDTALQNMKKMLRVNGVLLLGANEFVSDQQYSNPLVNTGFDSVSTLNCGPASLIYARNATEYAELPRNGNSLKPKWLIIEDSSQMHAEICKILQENDRDVIQVKDFANIFTQNQDHLEGVLYFCTKFDSSNIQENQRRQASIMLDLLKNFEAVTEHLILKPKIVLVTRGVYSIGDSEPGNPNGATAWGILKSFRNENPSVNMKLIDLDPTLNDLAEHYQILSQLWTHDEEFFVAIRQNKTFVLRMTYAEKSALPIQLPNVDRFKMINPDSGTFTDIEIGPMGRMELVGDMVEVEVRAAALNFKDLFMVLKPEGFSLPQGMSPEVLQAVGMDVAGIVTAVGPRVTRVKVGDEVCGLTYSGALRSHAIASEAGLMKIPPCTTFEEAATIPCVFLTVHVSLLEVTTLKPSDRVLIHAATGGVGLAAIQVVREAGAEIFATAGNRRKRAYLRSLGIKYVYNSRDTSYGAQIEKDTQGLGVTVVLNSLTGPNFKETTLKACSHGARFIEIGKVNIWKPEEVQVLRPDVEYTVVDLNILGQMDGRSYDIEHHFQVIQDHVNSGAYRGLPYIAYPLVHARTAFANFQKAKHIGKLVIQIPKYGIGESGKFEHRHYIFNNRSSYLITGGLGGLGMEVAKWMRGKGAETIVIVGRSSPSQMAQNLIDTWNRQGSQIIVISTDISTRENCKRLLELLQDLKLPTLRGIMHAAGVLSDANVNKQTLESVETALKPKVYGGWHLHELTLDYQLEFFVMFSSMSGIVGMLGQCNHAAANRFLDALAHYRISLGLPAVTINWGAWSDVGVAAKIGITTEVFSGMRMFTPAQGIAALEKIMTSNENQVCVSEVADWNVVKNMFRQGCYFDEMKSSVVEENKLEKYNALIEEIRKATSVEDRQTKLQAYIAVILKLTLAHPESDVLDIDQNFSELGVDSLMGMELRNRFQTIVGDRNLSISAMQENRTIRTLSAHLAFLMSNEGVETRQLADIVKSDLVLPAEIRPAEIPAKLPSQFKNILLTGVTGHLGIYILAQLVQHEHLTVHCLVRAKSQVEARERLDVTLKQHKLEIPNLEAVHLIPGDFSQDHFGMNPDEYAKLTEKIDAVMHFGAKVNHADSYSDGSRHDIRTHNVLGLVNVLKFSSCHRTKPLLFASSLITAVKCPESENLIEDYPLKEDMGTGLTWGYQLSKFIGEKLMREASDRGLPVMTVRIPVLFGSSESGYMPPGFNHTWATILASIRVRMTPIDTLNGVPIIAVDSAANVLTQLFLNDKAELGLYNLTVDSTLSKDIINECLLEYGITCEAVSFEEWREAIFEDGGDLVGPLMDIYSEGQGGSHVNSMMKQTQDLNVSTFSLKVLRNFPNVSKLVTSPDLIVRRQLQAYFQSGMGTS